MGLEKNSKQVVSKQRVMDHGEVYTNEREVNAMLDLVKQETERIESRFLEPACGTGNFLTEILRRKLQIVSSRYQKSQFEYERYAILAVSSIYGIDILEDNVRACRKRLFDIFDEAYQTLFKDKTQESCRVSIRYILDKNIIWGDALTLLTVDAKPRPIVFPEWSLVNGNMIKRRDFTYKELLSNESMKELPLFSDLGDEVLIPTPLKEYPLMPFLGMSDA